MVDKPRKVIVISGKQLLTAVVTVLVSIITIVGIGIVYTNYKTEQSNQAWCDIINGLDTRYRKLPPDADPDAKVFARQVATIKQKYDCSDK